MKMAFIPPACLISMLNATTHMIHKGKINRPVHMYIASEMNKTYNDFYTNAVRGGFIIADNGVWETGNSMGAADLVSRAICIGASEIIIPDTMKDMAATLGQLDNFMTDTKIAYLLSRHPHIRLMVVPQGENIEEWHKCRAIMEQEYKGLFDTIGIPKWLGGDSVGGIDTHRGLLLTSTGMKWNPLLSYHMLGLNSLHELYSITRTVGNHIRSIDTSLPFVAAQQRYQLQLSITGSASAHMALKRVPDYFSAPIEEFNTGVAADNVATMLNIISNNLR